MGRVVNKRELSEITDISQQTISEWQAKGLPYVAGNSRHGGNQYDTAAVIRWLRETDVAKACGGETPRDRLARVQADRVEMEIAEKRRELIPAGEIGQEWASVIVATRQALLVVPQEVAPLCVGIDDPDPIREILQDAIEEALSRLAEDDESRAVPDTPGDDGPVGTPAAHVAVVVG